MPNQQHTEKTKITVGELVAAFLEQCGVKAAFGVISIHNMPILDAFAQRGAIRFVPSRGEAGAGNMADAYARSTSSLGICITSTGPAAGNIAGSLVEAITAGAPVLHITGQIETEFLDRDMGYIHEAPKQLEMLEAVSKAAYRVRHPEEVLGVLRTAVQAALSAPSGPVSVEIPIDIQQSLVAMPDDISPLHPLVKLPCEQALDALAEKLSRAKRPMIWLGGGARHGGAAVRRLQAMGFGVVSSVQGRGIIPEAESGTLGAYNLQAPIEQFYQSCDAMLVVGSKLRSNETLKYELKLPKPLYRIDADPYREGRSYPSEQYLCADSKLSLEGLAQRLEAKGYQADPQLIQDLDQARDEATAVLLDGLGPYSQLVEQLQSHIGQTFHWVRDITLSNSTWGNRELRLFEPTAGIHATGGGIGQGMPMAIGAAVASQAYEKEQRTYCLAGDGGFILNLGELATAVQEQVDMVIILMNDRGYGVIKNIQTAQYGSRYCYVDLVTPDYATLCNAIGVKHRLIQDLSQVGAALDEYDGKGPLMLEVDMNHIGGFKVDFAGPPVNKAVSVAALKRR